MLAVPSASLGRQSLRSGGCPLPALRFLKHLAHLLRFKQLFLKRLRASEPPHAECRREHGHAQHLYTPEREPMLPNLPVAGSHKHRRPVFLERLAELGHGRLSRSSRLRLRVGHNLIEIDRRRRIIWLLLVDPCLDAGLR